MIVPEPEVPGGERAKLLDFGIAKILEATDEPGGAGVLTKRGTGPGTGDRTGDGVNELTNLNPVERLLG